MGSFGNTYGGLVGRGAVVIYMGGPLGRDIDREDVDSGASDLPGGRSARLQRLSTQLPATHR